jgi:TPR repeat protein
MAQKSPQKGSQKSFLRVLAATVALAAVVAACQTHQAAPTQAEIESTAMHAAQSADAASLQRLKGWAAYGMPVAQRELGLIYRKQPAQRDDAMRLLEHAGRSGDAEAAFALGEMLRAGDPAAAWPWFKQAAEKKHAKAALALGQLARNGEGVPRSEVEAAHWLTVASELGNPHAMFLLSNAYKDGQGVQRDAKRAHELLEESAEHEYPPALQELAMSVEGVDQLRASHLMKEATEHRRNNWNRF